MAQSIYIAGAEAGSGNVLVGGSLSVEGMISSSAGVQVGDQSSCADGGEGTLRYHEGLLEMCGGASAAGGRLSPAEAEELMLRRVRHSGVSMRLRLNECGGDGVRSEELVVRRGDPTLTEREHHFRAEQ